MDDLYLWPPLTYCPLPWDSDFCLCRFRLYSSPLSPLGAPRRIVLCALPVGSALCIFDPEMFFSMFFLSLRFANDQLSGHSQVIQRTTRTSSPIV